MIYHIISLSEWKQAKEVGEYAPESLLEEGFIHCSTDEQVTRVANNLFKGEQDLLVLGINEEKVKAKIIYEDLYELNELFPHIYGSLDLVAVDKIYRLLPDANGEFHFQRSEDLEWKE